MRFGTWLTGLGKGEDLDSWSFGVGAHRQDRLDRVDRGSGGKTHRALDGDEGWANRQVRYTRSLRP